MSTSLYMQFDPRVESGDRYAASDVLANTSDSESLSNDDGGASSSAGGAYFDANLSAGGDGYALTPVLHGPGTGAAKESKDTKDGPRTAISSSSGSSSAGVRAASPAVSEKSSSSSTQLSQGHRPWNREHQEMAKNPRWFLMYPQLAALTQQFQETAYTYGRLIISERALAPEARSIKPINIGGVAGGDKYVHNGILFKFATDPVVAEIKGRPVYLFGGAQPSDEKAIKAMSRELLGADRYWGTFQDDLHYPMMCLIDHKGFRLLAMAVLPISHDTLVYGSADGGRTVHTDDPKVNAVMEKVGKALNLKGHYVGLNEQHFIYGAGDVEVHLGTDGRYYVVDFARCSAPEAPPDLGDRRTVFSRLLRPEFTRTYKKPLCADAFSRWDANRDDALQHARDVIEATQYLYDSVVPAVAQRLTSDVAAIGVSFDVSEQLTAAGGHAKHRYVFDPTLPIHDVTERPAEPPGTGVGGIDELDDDLDASISGVLSAPRPIGRRVARLVVEQLDLLGDVISSHQLHKAGINVRHLGRVRAATTCPQTRMLILSTCVARVLKMQLNERMREEMRQLSLPADMPFKALICKFLAQMMCGFAGDQHWDTKVSRYFWRDELKRELHARFEHCLSAEESAPDFDLRQAVSYKLVYSIFLKLTGIQLTDKALTHLWKSETSSFAINRYDILDVGSRSQSTQTYYVSAGISTMLYALETDDSDNHRTVRRMLHDAFDQLRSGWQRSTEGGLPLVMMAVCVSEIACRKRRRNRRNAEWRRAEMWWDRAIRTWPAPHVFDLYLRCLRNYRDRLNTDLARLEARKNSVTAGFGNDTIEAARARAAFYCDQKRRASEQALTNAPPPAAAAAAAAAPAAADGDKQSTAPAAAPLSRSASRLLAFEAYTRPKRKIEPYTSEQLVSCNVTAAIVALDEERASLKRIEEMLAAALVRRDTMPAVDHSIVKAFRFVDSALNRDVCTPLASGLHATNTRRRRHYT